MFIRRNSYTFKDRIEQYFVNNQNYKLVVGTTDYAEPRINSNVLMYKQYF